MTDRQIVYPGALPADTDILGLQRDMMIAIGYLAQAALGSGTVVWGLAGTQTTVPGMAINVGPGAIAGLSTVDATAFGSLPSDANPLVKIGINEGATSFTLTAPTTSGQSINYLIEATLAETDSTPVVLPYYNASNPSSPYLGPSNNGVAQNTQRLQRCSLQLKAGVAATTGTQTTPAVDGGWVGLYVITVNYGQTTVTNSQIVAYSPASVLPSSLGKVLLATSSLSDASAALTTSGWVQALFATATSTATSGFSKGGSSAIAFPSATAAAGTIGSSGWSKDPSGKISQWAYVQLIDPGAPSNNGTTWTFPIAFSAPPLKVRGTNCAIAAGQNIPAINGLAVLTAVPAASSAVVACHNTGTTGTLVVFLLEAEGY